MTIPEATKPGQRRKVRPPFYKRFWFGFRSRCHFAIWLFGYFCYWLPTQFLLHLCRQVHRAWCYWRGPRRWRDLFAGTPAALAVLGAMGLGVWSVADAKDELVHRYGLAADQASQEREFAVADLCYQRLALLDGASIDQCRFGQVLIAEQLGQEARARALIIQLAPRDHLGYPPAHLHLARRLLRVSPPEQLAYLGAEAHLLLLVRSPSRNQAMTEEAHALLAQLYAMWGKTDLEETHLRVVVSARPGLYLALARLYEHEGDHALAKEAAQQAAAYFRQRATLEPAIPAYRFAWSDALVLSQEFAEAAALWEKELPCDRDNSCHRALAGVYVAWSDAEARSVKPEPGRRLALLEQALAADVNNALIYERLLGMIQQAGAESAQIRTLLRGLLAAGKTPALVHLVLGTDASAQGDGARAREHLEEAYRLAPGMLAVANNLAWTLARRTPPELPRALELLDGVVAQAPKEPSFRTTRGRVFIKMELWKEALSDLERALAVKDSDPALHQDLALVYQKLGMGEMAEQHRLLANRGRGR